MTRLLLLFSIFFSNALFGQRINNVERRANIFCDSLVQNNSDTILNYTLTCVGGFYRTDTCDFYHDYYLFWKQDGNTFFQKFDGCNSYKTILLDTNNPLTFYISQKTKIDHEIIYPPTYVQSQHGDTGTLIEQSIDHTCYYEMTFIIKGKKVIKSVRDYDLTFKTFDNGRKNMYYNYNQHTQLRKLINLLKQFTKQIDTNKQIEVQ